MRRRILVIGSGGREFAIVWKLAQGLNNNIFCAPGNAGIAQHATCVPIKVDAIDNLIKFVEDNAIDLTIVGPELPLVNGIVDRFRERGLLICGPTEKAAQAEGSKIWFKRMLDRYSIPTAPFKVFDDRDAALQHIRNKSAGNIVIKADGLMGGKGVILPSNLKEAEIALKKLMVTGTAGETVIIEDRLVGVERSVIAATDGKKVYVLPFTQDYKRVGDGDKGPNTGGMGAHTLSLSEKEADELQDILRSVIIALDREGCTYSGFIYLGFIMTVDGPMVLECNIRLGDPEAQVILPSIECDFGELCMALAKRELSKVSEPIQNKQAVCVVLTSADYPDSSNSDDEIKGLVEAMNTGALVFHAGTGIRGCKYTTNKSGRVMGIVSVGDTLNEAWKIAYKGAERVQFPGVKYRRDIYYKKVSQ
jgi:phosphoribosylamine--glycine ligase